MKSSPEFNEEPELISDNIRYEQRRHSNLLQDSCLENPMDRGAWWATIYGVTLSQTRLKQLSMHACMYYKNQMFTLLLYYQNTLWASLVA